MAGETHTPYPQVKEIDSMRQCYGCVYFEHESEDYATGAPEISMCLRPSVIEDAPDREQTMILFETILFALSGLNNCPEYASKKDYDLNSAYHAVRKPRQSISNHLT